MKVTNVFLIEDDTFFAKTFIKKMEQIGPFKVHHYNNCEDAIQQVRNIKPEVIFMDHVLRGTKGVDAIPSLLQQKPDARVVVISNQNDINVVDRAFSYGASRYYRKDILLLDYVETYIRGIEGESRSSAKFLFA
ncbi:MAG: response regulator [Crocinitomicaceae bacterium]|nr:response regulator transcription factor [Crocinitomicaceae bacterium]